MEHYLMGTPAHKLLLVAMIISISNRIFYGGLLFLLFFIGSVKCGWAAPSGITIDGVCHVPGIFISREREFIYQYTYNAFINSTGLPSISRGDYMGHYSGRQVFYYVYYWTGNNWGIKSGYNKVRAYIHPNSYLSWNTTFSKFGLDYKNTWNPNDDSEWENGPPENCGVNPIINNANLGKPPCNTQTNCCNQ